MKADETLPVPPLEAFKAILDPTAEGREISTTQAYVRVITVLLRDAIAGQARGARSWWTRRAPSAWKACSARSASSTSSGQLYEPVDKDQVSYYREDKAGQILQEGINEAGAHELVDRGGDVVLDQQPRHDPVLHVLLDVRPAAHRRPGLGRRRHARARLPAGRHRRAAPRSTAKACSTRTATATCWRRPFRTACPTTRPSPTKSR